MFLDDAVPLQYGSISLNLLLLLLLLLLLSTLLFSALFYASLQCRTKNQALLDRGIKGVLLLPSPPTLPVVGNLHQLGSLPHRSLRALARTHGPLMLLHLGRVPTVVVSSAEAARDVMRTHDVAFASRPPSSAGRRLMYGYRDVALAPYGEYWRRARRICVLHLLSSKQVQSSRAVREEEVASLVKDIFLSSNCSINLSDKVVDITSGIICRVALGKRYSGRDHAGQGFRELLTEFVALLGAFNVGDFIPSLAWVDKLSGFDARLEKNFQQLDRFLDIVVEEHLDPCKGAGDRNEDENKDFVHVLLSLLAESDTDGFTLDRESIKALILDMFLAGTDTASTTIEWAMAELVSHPAVMKKVQDEVRGVVGEKTQVCEDDLEQLTYLRSVVKEVLRLHPPAPLLAPRESLTGVLLGGYEIPAKTRIIINAWAIARDPALWERPEEFWPERFTDSPVDFTGQHFQFIPFGAGRRGCPGTLFGMAIVELELANLLHHFDWSVPDGSGGEDLDMDEAWGITTHKKSSLVLVPLPRFSSARCV